jgi:hypothetical protein
MVKRQMDAEIGELRRMDVARRRLRRAMIASAASAPLADRAAW